MLVEFRVKNFLSFQGEQVLSLVASENKEHKDTHTFNPTNSNNLSLLKSVSVYGANASGKSNLIKAVNAMRGIVRRSFSMHKYINRHITPFLLGDSNSNPTEFEVTFFVDDVRYQYGFSITKERIVEEWLISYCKNKKPQELFSRIYNKKSGDYKWIDNLDGTEEAKKLWRESTRDDALFLSVAMRFNNKQLGVVYNWFDAKLKICNIGGWSDSTEVTTSICRENETTKQKIVNFFKIADFDIEDIQIKEIEFAVNNIPTKLEKQNRKILNSVKRVNIGFHHLMQDGRNVVFNMADESDGTQRFFQFIGPILDSLNKGNILFIDELHTHFHPLMTKFLIELFYSELNTKNAQLIFTTHETSLLKKEIFRKDQIYFCEKLNKATHIYSLNDFKISKNDDMEQSYLRGEYGAVPYFREICKNMEIKNGQ